MQKNSTQFISKFSQFWDMVTTNENFIRDYGNRPRPDTERLWHQDIEDAYQKLAECLTSVSEKRLFGDLPCGLNPFPADNAHQALAYLLNPPERWFGDIGVLESIAYLRLKDQVKHEQECVINMQRTAETSLTECQQKILDALTSMPQTWDQIYRKIDFDYNSVRRSGAALVKSGHVVKLKQGFVRSDRPS